MTIDKLNVALAADPEFPLRKKIGAWVGTAIGSVLVLLIYAAWYFEKEFGNGLATVVAFVIAIQAIVVFSTVMCYVYETRDERVSRYKKNGLVYAPESSVSASGLAKAILSAISIALYATIMVFPYIIVASALLVLEVLWFITTILLLRKRSPFCEVFLAPWITLIINVGIRLHYKPTERHLIN